MRTLAQVRPPCPGIGFRTAARLLLEVGERTTFPPPALVVPGFDGFEAKVSDPAGFTLPRPPPRLDLDMREVALTEPGLAVYAGLAPVTRRSDISIRGEHHPAAFAASG